MKVKTNIRAGISCTPTGHGNPCNGGWPLDCATGDSGGTLN